MSHIQTHLTVRLYNKPSQQSAVGETCTNSVSTVNAKEGGDQNGGKVLLGATHV